MRTYSYCSIFRCHQQKSTSLGKILSWNGEERDARIEDFDKKYSCLSSSQLILHLQQSLSSMKRVDSLGITPSLLQPLSVTYNNGDISHREGFRSLAIQLIESSAKLRRVSHEYQKQLRRQVSICKELQTDITDNDAEIGMNLPGIESEQEMIVLDEDESGDRIMVQTIMQPVLKEIGLRKELIMVTQCINEAINKEMKLTADVARHKSELLSRGCLSSGVDRGCIDSGICFLEGRMLGLTNLNVGQTRAVGQSMIPSAARIRKKLMNDYKLLWTSSGHALNPAYCTIIDSSGRFAITGADDYLVKVWDIDRGTLALTCRGHDSFISIIALSPDNSLLASACTAGVIRIWRLRDGCCIEVLKHGLKQVNWVSFDPTNCALTSVGDDGNCIVWDLSSLLRVQPGDVPLIDAVRLRVQNSDGRGITSSRLRPFASPSLDTHEAVFVEKVGEIKIKSECRVPESFISDLEIDAVSFATSLTDGDNSSNPFTDSSNCNSNSSDSNSSNCNSRNSSSSSSDRDSSGMSDDVTHHDFAHSQLVTGINTSEPSISDVISPTKNEICPFLGETAGAVQFDILTTINHVQKNDEERDEYKNGIEIGNNKQKVYNPLLTTALDRLHSETEATSQPSETDVVRSPDIRISSSASASTASASAITSYSTFDWNRRRGQFEENRNKLILPHIRDTHLGATNNDGMKVQCLDVSPLGGLLATGCEDGIVRVWRYGMISTDDSSPKSSSSRSNWNKSSSSSSSSSGYNDEVYRTLKQVLSPGELERVERVSEHMLIRLEGHVSAVTDLRFSNQGDRVVTGSLLDGTVRIWSFTKDYSQNDHIVLVMADGDEEGSSTAGQNRAGGRRTMNKKKNKPQVNSVCWTMNDLCVITLQSVQMGDDVNPAKAIASTRLKVWDSVTGDLLRVIATVSTVSANVLYPHPLDPSVCVTGGEDGTVCIWDIDKEERLSTHYFANPLPGAIDEIRVHDASFSPDGSRLAVTDSLGRLSIFGLDDPARYSSVAPEQYYSTDYQDIMVYVRFHLI